jgi:prepilin peptidase CpaA
MNIPIALALVALLALAVWLDLWQQRIPNVIVAAVALLWLPYALCSYPDRVLGSLATGAVVLAIGMITWRLGWLGGDVKLVAALTLWAGAKDTPLLLAIVALSGGVLALLWRSRLRHAAAWLSAAAGAWFGTMPTVSRPAGSAGVCGAPATGDTASLPYGVAVAAGGCWLVHRLLTA